MLVKISRKRRKQMQSGESGRVETQELVEYSLSSLQLWKEQDEEDNRKKRRYQDAWNCEASSCLHFYAVAEENDIAGKLLIIVAQKVSEDVNSTL